jgi:uncharacterized protein DUF349
MSFLDRFKPQPKYRHPDPAVRLAGVAELPDDAEHWGVIAELAASDEDVRVRRAASARINNAGYLARIARTERDDSLKRELADRLVTIANAAADSDADAATALEGLTDQKQIAVVAKSSAHAAIRAAALARVHDGKLLGSIARHAEDGAIALAAAARVTDAAELQAIALKTDHKDAGLAALERARADAGDAQRRGLLDEIASRAKNKAVSKRARALVQELDDAEAARKAEREEWQKRVALAMARLDALAASPAAADAAAQVGDVEAEWQTLAPAADSDTTDRFHARVADARAAIDAHARAEAERRDEEARAAARRAAFVALCEHVEALRGDDTPTDLERARAEWEGMPGATAQEREDAELRARFEDACRRATERHHNRQALEQIHARLTELSFEAERLSLRQEPAAPATAAAVPAADGSAAETDASGAHADTAAVIAAASPVEGADAETSRPDSEAAVAETADAARQQTQAWRAVTGEWHTLIARADGLDPAVLARFTDAEARVKLRADEKRAAAERALKQQLQRLEQLIDRSTTRAAAEDLTLREADRAVRDLKAAIDAPPALPSRDQHALVERLKAAMGVMAPRLHDLREMDEWKRFANAAVQEELIAKTEALREKYHIGSTDPEKPEDVEKAARDLHEIQERWKQVAEAPRAQAQALWHRYRQAADPIQARAREFFALRAEERTANLQQKMVLVERAEALAESTDWIKTADELKKLQAEWQKIGPIPRQDTKTTWKRFRDACDRFFTRRNADLSERKETWAANLARKDALCVRAEELAASREWDKAAAEIRRLQAEWKTIGPVRRSKSEAIWNRFRAACDTFFDRYKRRDEIELESKQADREALVTEIESLASTSPESAAELPPDLLERVRSLRTRWNQTTPVVRHGADPLSARFVDALERLMASHPDAFRGTELDADASRQKMEKLVAKVEGFVSDAGAQPSTGSQALADMLREALAANTIGGRAGEESKWRAMAEEVRQAQSSWSRLGPVPGDAGRQLAERFHRACNKFFEQFRRKVPPSQQPAHRGRPVGAR